LIGTAAARLYPRERLLGRVSVHGGRAGFSALTEAGEAAGSSGRGLFGRLDAFIRRRAAAYREAKGIDLYARSDPTLEVVSPDLYGRLPKGFGGGNRKILGITTDQGQAFVRADLEGEKLIVAARHEVLGHRTWVPEAVDFVKPVLQGEEGRTLLQAARRELLNRSRIFDFIDEARAHEIATGSFGKGVLYATDVGKFQSGRMLAEAAAGGTATYLGVSYGTYYGGMYVMTPGL
jgi:hypothetical protein